MQAWLLYGLAGAVVLLVISRTQKGAQVASDAVGSAVDAAKKVSTALLPRGVRNNNPGNIDFIADPSKAWRGQVGSDGRFGIYDSPANGVRAIGKELLLDERRGIRTIRGLINNWAPPVENNTSAYVHAVAQAVGVGPDEPVSIASLLPQIVKAIIRHENGQVPYTDNEIKAWAFLA